LLAAIVVISAPASDAFAQSRQFTCTGALIAPSLEQSALTVRLNLGSAKVVALDTGSGIINAPILSNNKIQLKF